MKYEEQLWVMELPRVFEEFPKPVKQLQEKLESGTKPEAKKVAEF